MVEGQVVRGPRLTAILADKAIAQEHVEAREGRAPRGGDEFLERDHAGKSHLKGWAADHGVVFGDDIDAVEKYRLYSVLPRPQRQGEVAQRPKVGVEHQC